MKHKNILNKNISNLKISIILLLPIFILFLVFQYFFNYKDIISKTILFSVCFENPSKIVYEIKDKFSDVLIPQSLDLSENIKQKSKKPFEDFILESETPQTLESEKIEKKTEENFEEVLEKNFDEKVIEFVPEEYRGIIIEENFKGGSFPLYIETSPGYISNKTKINSLTLKNNIDKMSKIQMSIDDNPQVLLFSTHATESFEPCDRKFYDKRYNSRSTDNDKNVTQIEDEIAKQLNINGINTIVDKTQHDFPSYNGSYNRSAETINKYLKKYPSIKVVLDIHRDAIERENGDRVKPVALINNKKAAQIMLISGCDDGSMNFPNWEQNLNFAVDLQRQLETDNPGITRPVFFCYRKYNMNLCPCSLLIEFGSNSNSLNEVVYSGELFGKSLAKLILSYCS